MQTHRNEHYIKRDFGFYDSGILGCLPHIVFNTYEVIRRWVWRSVESGDPDSRRLFREGKLATRMSQPEIGLALDRDRKVINEHIARMKSLGWLKVIQDPDHLRPATYILGEQVSDSFGRKHEVFYADAWMRALWETLEDRAKEEFGEDGRVTQLEWNTRRELCRSFIESSEESTREVFFPSKSSEVEEVSEDFLDTPVSLSRIPPSAFPVGGQYENPTEKITKPTAVITKQEYNSRPAHSRGIAHLDSPTKRSARSSPGGAASAAAVNKKREIFENSAAGTNEFTGNSVEKRLTSLRGVVSGDVVPSLDAKQETYKEKVERARASQMANKAAKESRLSNLGGRAPIEQTRALKHLEGVWLAQARETFGGVAGAWQPSDKNMVKQLLASYDTKTIESAMIYLIANWQKLGARLFKGTAGRVPTIGVLSRCHASLMPEAADYVELAEILNLWTTWYAEHPNDDPPAELEQRYLEAAPKLRAMGMIS